MGNRWSFANAGVKCDLRLELKSRATQHDEQGIAIIKAEGNKDINDSYLTS